MTGVESGVPLTPSHSLVTDVGSLGTSRRTALKGQMDEQGGPAKRYRGNSGEGGDSRGKGRACGGFSNKQGVTDMPWLHVHTTNRFTILDIEKADNNVLSQNMPTSWPTLEFSVQPWIE